MSDETKEADISALREDLARRGREAHQQLEALLATCSEEQMTWPDVTDDWSVKDHLAHLTWWGGASLPCWAAALLPAAAESDFI